MAEPHQLNGAIELALLPPHVRHSVADDNAAEDGDDEMILEDIARTEATGPPKRSLGFVQCSALMINQMVGTGIFTLPGLVLLLTKEKSTAIALWAVGGVYSLLGVLIHLEFGTALPFNGGSLIYLEETFHRPELFTAIIFSFFWILLSSTAGTCIAFSQYALRIANNNAPLAELDDRLIRFVGLVINTTTCLLLYFLRRLCFVANNFLALFKVAFLLVVIFSGFTASRSADSGRDDWFDKTPGHDPIDTLAALVYILYAYQGWEHTNYIAGEIRSYEKTLRDSAFFAVGLVTVLYIALVSALYYFADYDSIQKQDADLGVAALIGKTVFGSTLGIRVCITLSAFSNLIANTYTITKVKQAIAWQRFIPFAGFFGKQDPQFDSPGGALILHWFFTAVEICIADSKSDTYYFIIGIFPYGYQINMLFLGLGMFRLTHRMRILRSNPLWKPKYMTSRPFLWTISLLFIGLNLLMIGVTAIPQGRESIPRYYWPITVAACLLASILYWAAFKALQMKFGSEKTLGERVGVEISVYKDDDRDIPEGLVKVMQVARIDGGRRRVTYKLSGFPLQVKKGWEKLLKQDLVR